MVTPVELVLGATGWALSKEVLGTLFERVVEAASGPASKTVTARLKSALKRWQTDAGIKQLHTRSKQICRVKTLWQVERELDLLDFYYPSKLTAGGGTAREIQSLTDLPVDGNVIVRGTVGQGKSIFLRYLSARELGAGTSVPVFLELRRLQGEQPLADAVVEELKNLGLAEADEDTFEVLAKSGRLALLLDGFDELAEARVSTLVAELETLSVRRPSLRIIVSSRPESALEHSPFFRVLNLAPLAPGEYARVIERIAHNPKLAKAIAAGVRSSHESIARLLTTPLMVSLLLVHYRVGQGIPENRVAFYEPIFQLLLQRHDKSKAGYVRPRHSGLSDSELRNFFNCLCFVTRKDRISVLKHHELTVIAARALKHLALNPGKADAVVDDIGRITCLLLHEGAEYRFLHKSVQEFHAASFVRDQPDNLVADFYAELQQRWSEWQHELLFLEAIDGYRFNRFFAVPLLERVVTTLPGANPSELGKALIGRLTLRVTFAPQHEVEHPRYPLDAVGWCLIHYFEGSSELLSAIYEAAARLVRRPADGPQRDVQVAELFGDIGEHPALLNDAARLGEKLAAGLERHRSRVHVVDDRKGLFEL